MKNKKRNYKRKASDTRSDSCDDNEVMTWLECQTGTYVVSDSNKHYELCIMLCCSMYVNYLTI
jgi:hypothetical protein